MQEHNPVDPHQQEGQEREQRRAEDALHEQWVADLVFVMGDKRGRRFVWRLLTEAKIYHTVYQESQAAMALLEGKRQIGLFLVDEIERECPSEYDKMKAEQRKNVRPN